MDKARIILGATAGLMTITNTTYASPVTYVSKVPHVRSKAGIYNSPVKYFTETDRLFNRLNEFLELENNWDGMGAVSPLFETIENAKMLIDILRDKYLKLLDIEDIVPSPYGTISFYFEDSNGSELSVEIGKEFIGLSGEIEDEEIIIDDVPLHEITPVTDKINLLQPID